MAKVQTFFQTPSIIRLLLFVKNTRKKDVPHNEAHPFGILFTLSFTPHNEALKHSPASHRELEIS